VPEVEAGFLRSQKNLNKIPAGKTITRGLFKSVRDTEAKDKRIGDKSPKTNDLPLCFGHLTLKITQACSTANQQWRFGGVFFRFILSCG
jgi:hypothetical protein